MIARLAAVFRPKSDRHKAARDRDHGGVFSTNRGIILFAIVLLVALGGRETYRIFEQRDAALADMRKDIGNLSRSLAQHAEEVVRGTDAMLIGLVGQLNVGGTRQIDYDRIRTTFQEEVSHLPHIQRLALVDADGTVLVSASKVLQLVNASRSDRDYYRHHRHNPDTEVFFGAPTRDDATGRWSLPMTRRLTDKDGSFMGLVKADLDPQFFQGFYAGFDIGQNGSILLASAQGHLLVRRPFAEKDIGRDLSQGALFVEHLPRSPSGIAELASSSDGQTRLVAYARLSSYPLIVVVAQSTSEFLATWRHQSQLEVAQFIILGLVIAGFGTLVVRASDALLRSRASLRLTLETMSQGLMVTDKDGRLVTFNRRAINLLELPEELADSKPTIVDILDYQARNGEFATLAVDTIAAADPTTKSESYNYERTRPNGTTLEIATVPRQGGGFVRTYTDVSERNRMERALREANARLEALARTDGLTGLANRRLFDETLEAELGRAKREGSTLSLLMVDADSFKSYNDRYGHIRGDDCLRAIAGALKSTLLRPGDLVARFGGEEFAVVLPGTDREGARHVAERLNKVVRELAITHEGASGGVATVSIGVATLGARSALFEPQHLISSADGALYAAKTAGRDRVRVAEIKDVVRLAATG